MIQGALSHVLLKYATTAVALPWEVGKTLLQVQWVPRDAQTHGAHEQVEGEEPVEDDSVRARSFRDTLML